MLAERTFGAGEVELNHVEGPDVGPPLLLLHGAADRWQSFLSILPSLVMRWHVYAPDLRGHGLSGRVAGCYAISDYVGDILSFLSGCVRQPAAIYGHSLGGMAGIQLAAENPGWVRSQARG